MRVGHAQACKNCGMWRPLRRHGGWLVAWTVLTALGGLVLARVELNRLREAFETDARIAHRLLSQQVVQHDAILATLALLQPSGPGGQAEQRLTSVYPQIIAVQRRDRDGLWPSDTLLAAEQESRLARRAVLANLNLAQGRYDLVLSATPASYALTIDLRSAVPWGEWPMQPDKSPVRAVLAYAGQTFTLQSGQVANGGWRFDFRKHLAAESQPFDVVAARQAGWHELPWSRIVLWGIAVAAVLAALQTQQRQRAARRRAEELVRFGQVTRLNTLGELAAGMAHELNQPLTAVLANTQAADRLLREEPPEIDTARHAMEQAAQQARRASDVVARLRHAVERPDPAGQLEPLALRDAVATALDLLEPELARRSITPQVTGGASAVTVLAEPVALDQIIHNLLMNALQALEQVPSPERDLRIDIAAGIGDARGMGVLAVLDTGPGIPPEVMPRIFEPFFTTRSGGLGLGLSLCESLASGMGGTLSVADQPPRGTALRLALPLATMP